MSFECFHGKKILITGHNGFKGTWLFLWLEMLGAEVYGISLPLTSSTNHYNLVKDTSNIRSYEFDIRNSLELKEVMSNIEPDYIFHLAALAQIIPSFKNPKMRCPHSYRRAPSEGTKHITRHTKSKNDRPNFVKDYPF